MTAERYYLGAFWGNRSESAEACADRALALLSGLSRCDQAFASWYETGRSRKDALSRRVSLDAPSLRRLLERGRYRRDSDRSVIETLGFSVGIWNGEPDDTSATLRLHCGCYASTPRVWLPNSCILDLPPSGAVARRILAPDVLARLLGVVVEALEPDWAVVTSRAYRDALPEAPARTPVVGWWTYLSAGRGPIPALPGPARVIPIGALGAVMVLTPERVSASDPEQVAMGERLRQMLDEAGLLRRIES